MVLGWCPINLKSSRDRHGTDTGLSPNRFIAPAHRNRGVGK